MIVRNNGTEDYLAGYYTAEKEIPFDALKRFLKSRLTPYMVPDAMMQLEEMPLTVNGKIDKKRLPDLRDALEEREYIAPEGILEEKVSSFFASVLHLKKVGATDNFFEIGGTSLSVANVVADCMKAGLDIVYKNVFDHPTPRALAAFVEQKKKTEPAARKPRPVDKDAKSEVTPSAKYHDILCKNSIEALPDLKTEPLGTVLLTGATGFLGIHVLHELLQRDDVPHIVCLVRGRQSIDPDSRLNYLLEYYFNDIFDALMRRKVRILDGDITDQNLPELLGAEAINTIINCAAVVKHFETGNLIHRVNYEGVLHLIDLALRKKARLVQISTLSIAGFIDADKVNSVILHETDYDLGQKAVIKYIAAKFEAEGAILDAMERQGLRGKIIRIGNLMGRRSDGEFQINFHSNGFINRLKAYKLIGSFPVSMMDTPVEFSPVDVTARAITLLAGTPDSYSVFHANNCHVIHFANVLEAFEDSGFHIDVVDDETFRDQFYNALNDGEKGIVVSSLVAYNGNLDETLQWMKWDNSYTIKALYRLGFSWPLISPQYLNNNLKLLSEMGFFDLDSHA